MRDLLGFAEPVSSWLHLLGVIVALAAAPRLIRLGPNSGSRVALAVFVTAAVILLSMSGVFHLLEAGTAERAVLHRLDHAAIWVLIAGTFTPIHAMLFRGVLRWGALTFIWVCAAAGIVIKTLFFSSFPASAGLALYLAFGWLGIVSCVLIARRHGSRSIAPLLWGGLAYSAGGAASHFGAPTPVAGYVGAHELFHVAVLLGLLAHWRFLTWIPTQACPTAERDPCRGALAF